MKQGLTLQFDGTAFDSYPRQKGELRGPGQPQGELEPRSDDSPHCDRRLGPVVLVGALAPISVAESTHGPWRTSSKGSRLGHDPEDRVACTVCLPVAGAVWLLEQGAMWLCPSRRRWAAQGSTGSSPVAASPKPARAPSQSPSQAPSRRPSRASVQRQPSVSMEPQATSTQLPLEALDRNARQLRVHVVDLETLDCDALAKTHSSTCTAALARPGP